MDPEPSTANPKRGDGRGNRRKGKARGRPGYRGRNKGSLPWRKDQLILDRVQLVGKHRFDSLRYSQVVVNKWLVEHGEDPISVATIVKDRRRYEELMVKRATHSSGVEKRLAQLEHVYEVFDVRLTRIPDHHGQSAAALGAVMLRAVEAGARLDGSWQGGGLDVQINIDSKSFGPTPREQFEAGQLSEEEYVASMRALSAEDEVPSLPPAEEMEEGPQKEGRPPPWHSSKQGGGGDVVEMPHDIDWNNSW